IGTAGCMIAALLGWSIFYLHGSGGLRATKQQVDAKVETLRGLQGKLDGIRKDATTLDNLLAAVERRYRAKFLAATIRRPERAIAEREYLGHRINSVVEWEAGRWDTGDAGRRGLGRVATRHFSSSPDNASASDRAGKRRRARYKWAAYSRTVFVEPAAAGSGSRLF